MVVIELRGNCHSVALRLGAKKNCLSRFGRQCVKWRSFCMQTCVMLAEVRDCESRWPAVCFDNVRRGLHVKILTGVRQSVRGPVEEFDSELRKDSVDVCQILVFTYETSTFKKLTKIHMNRVKTFFLIYIYHWAIMGNPKATSMAELIHIRIIYYKFKIRFK